MQAKISRAYEDHYFKLNSQYVNILCEFDQTGHVKQVYFQNTSMGGNHYSFAQKFLGEKRTEREFFEQVVTGRDKHLFVACIKKYHPPWSHKEVQQLVFNIQVTFYYMCMCVCNLFLLQSVVSSSVVSSENYDPCIHHPAAISTYMVGAVHTNYHIMC